jgi:hypothetical protein
MPTELQKKAFKRKMEVVKENKPVYMGRIMREVGFSEQTSRIPKVLTGSLGWKELQAKYADDEKALLTLNELADPMNDDKDNRLKASIEILKLNDRYPANKSKIIGLFDKLGSLE